MKKLVLILIITTLLIVGNVKTCFGDKLHVPFDVFPKELQQTFADRGIKLDLNGNDRTKDSFGFIDNQGSFYYIYTYRNLTDEELMMTMNLIWKNMGVKNE